MSALSNHPSDRKIIRSLSGLKALAMIALFWWHSPLKNPSVDLGARMCEVLFVMSGFLVAFNHWENGIPADYDAAFDYVKKKLIKVWPLHFFAFLIDVVSSVVSGSNIFTWKYFITAIVNLSFLQAWSTDRFVYFSFNGATWFLSALFFCYYVSPLLVEKAKKAKYPILVLAFVLLVRIVPELAQEKLGWNVFPLSYHVSPVIRVIEFYMGILLVPILFKTNEFIDKQWVNRRLPYTFIELLSVCLYVLVIIKTNGRWIRGYYLAFTCPLILTFANDRGLISKLLGSKPFALFSLIQLEFYILHQAIIHLYERCISIPGIGNKKASVIIFIICLVLAIGYRQISRKMKTERPLSKSI